ncbi:uncharacterized protein LOC132741638 [Ruditapes philippinarum]|uniref:uncharacterized protein LOC132741638 n=1 Tax=Ruditapes philippinarum TaxID=129788 RepID=UPI00295BDF18|nr:uncharacterized protein LOC132741638 [Ruditapes philippinarum]
MPTLEELSKQCISVCQVPVDVSREFIVEHIKRQFQGGGIVDTDRVDGIESGHHLTRLVLLCTALEDVDHMCKEVKEEEIDLEGKRFTVKYQTSVACELPERWEHYQIQEQGSKQDPQHTGGPEPPKLQQIPVPGHQNSQQYAWPSGPYGAVSGFYHNIPGSGDPNMNQGGMQGHFPGQQPMPGNEQQQGHGPQQGHAPHGPQQGHAPHPGQGHDPLRGQGHGQGMRFPFGPGGPGQMPHGFPPGWT